MLKAYAVALALSTAAPAADKQVENTAKKPVETKEVATSTNTWKRKGGGVIRF